MLPKFIKLLTKFVLLLFISIVIAIISAMMFFDPNDYKTEISNLVHKYTGRTLTINGKISWSLTPQITLNIPNITLSNTPNFAGDLVKAKELNIKLSLQDLFHKKIVINGIKLNNPEIKLIKAQNNHTNFADLTTIATANNNVTNKTIVTKAPISSQSSKQTGSTTKPTATTPMPSVTTSRLVNVTKPTATHATVPIIDKLTIENATITWHDLTCNKIIKLQNLNISAKNLQLNPNKILSPIAISGSIIGLAENFKTITFTTTLISNMANNTFEFKPLQITMANINANANLTITATKDLITINPINLELLSSKHQASIIINSKQSTPTLSLRNQTNVFPIEKILSELFQFKKLYGNTNITMDLSSKGSTTKAIKHSLQGNIDLTIQNGGLYGFDIHALLKQTENTLQTLFAAAKTKEHIDIAKLLTTQIQDWHLSQKTPNPKSTFNDLHAKASFQQGISQDFQLIIAHNDYDIKGNGTINLATETIDLTIQAFYKTITNNNDQKLANYILKTPLMILIQGDLYQPKIRPDTHSYCKEALKTLNKTIIKDVIQKTLGNIITNHNSDNNNQDNQLKNLEKKLFHNLFHKEKAK